MTYVNQKQIREAIRNLSSDEEEVRKRAVWLLHEQTNRQATYGSLGGVIPKLAKELQHQDKLVRRKLASIFNRIVGYVPIDEAIPRIIRNLADEDENIRQASFLTLLGELKTRNIPLEDVRNALEELVYRQPKDKKSKARKEAIQMYQSILKVSKKPKKQTPWKINRLEGVLSGGRPKPPAGARRKMTHVVRRAYA